MEIELEITSEHKIDIDATDDATLDELFSATLKKKKKKKKINSDSVEVKNEAETSHVATTCEEDVFDYSYHLLLDRAYSLLEDRNPNRTIEQRFRLPVLNVFKHSSTRTCWANIVEVCAAMQRNPEHVIQFVLSELATDGSVDGGYRFVIKGKFVEKKIQVVVRKYMKQYVVCITCNGYNTNFERDQVTRLHFIGCKDCGSSRTAASISTGFKATRKGDRKKART